MPLASRFLRLAGLSALFTAAGLPFPGCTGSGVNNPPVKGPTVEETVQQKFDGVPAEKPTEKEFTNSIGMKLILVEPGSFKMGWPDGPKLSPMDYEQFGGPVQPVTLTHPYYLGQTEVTQEQFEKVMGKNPSHFQKGKETERPDIDHGKLPVENVSWEAAREFCAKLSALPDEQAAGRVYTLPTEAQWEYASHAGADTNYAMGDKLDPEYAVTAESQPGGTLPVASRKPNAWGFYDMHGNVWEWCLDGRRKLADTPVTDPTTANETGKERMVRGGSFRQPDIYARSNFRNYYSKESGPFDYGFRVAIQR